MILPAISSRSSARRRTPVGGYLGLAALLFGAGACKVERDAAGSERVVTQVAMVRPAAERAPASTAGAAGTSALPASDEAEGRSEEAAAYCHQVELQALETNGGLPKKLDRDTMSTRVMAYGCDIILEYAMLDLAVGEVAMNGVHAMRGEVRERLCADRGALGVMAHGGSFTSVYRDERRALIDQFT
ncbi:MAG TPA: hypothetical protein VJU61_25580, partial [Polyangiaceae bacterium]|nr:hypothetical protein [Polyangiaceae bacterium]